MLQLHATHIKAKIVASLVLIFVLAGCSTTGPHPSPKENPLANFQFYVPPNSKAAQVRDALLRAGRMDEAEQIAKIAAQPSAIWLSGGSDDPALVAETMKSAKAAGTVPTFVLYNIPHRDEGSGFSARGAQDASKYRLWLSQLDGSLYDGKAIVIVEPDALAAIAAGIYKGDKDERISLLREAMQLTASHAEIFA
ncbi:MAG: hypothetical protein NVSMB39_7130 [Candidatus Saccharimonadales bacterium]